MRPGPKRELKRMLIAAIAAAVMIAFLGLLILVLATRCEPLTSWRPC